MRTALICAIGFSMIMISSISCENEGSIEFRRYYSSGALVYQSHCQNCHGTKGEGLSALIPPLTDSLYIRNNRSSLPCFVKAGLKGKITVKGKDFEDIMPANDLTPQQIAQVLTYIT
ncbi:MAG: c-type cytochrome, partial [Mucilaginibacter sp.]